MHIWESLTGCVKCEVVSASLSRFVSEVSQRCPLSQVEFIDDLTASFWVSRPYFPVVKKVAESKGDMLKITERKGVFWALTGFVKRPVLMIGLIVLAFLSFYLPTRVLFIGVEGNTEVSTSQILDAAQSCGIRFGASRQEVRSEKVKNTLLQALPQLQWACVNTSGCVAVISVQERNSVDADPVYGICDIAAARDGVITQMTVYSGTPLCQVGQAVQKGQVLVSGYTDLGLVVKATWAKAEIFAETQRDLTVSALTDFAVRKKVTRTENRYSLQIGKKLINFEKDSGISPAGCGRMYLESYATLPGGFQLPLAFIQERITYYETVPAPEQKEDSFAWMQEAGSEIVCGQMVAGEVLSSSTSLQLAEGACNLTSAYRCREMIGCVHNEEIFTDYGKRS